MKKEITNFLKIKSSNDFGQKLFLLGLFFLPTALPITGLFFIFSLFISYKFNKIEILKSKIDLGFLIALILIFLSSINNTFIDLPKELIGQNKILVWTSLFNWAPMIFLYWGFKPYLKTANQRIISLKFLISGCVPMLISFIMQLFSFYGPYKTFFSLIIWFNKPLDEFGGSYTGLFSNPNYAGVFLALIMPFLLFLIKDAKKENLITKFFLFIMISMTIFFALGTNSRNALIGIIISFFTLINLSKLSGYLLVGASSFLVFINHISSSFYLSKQQPYSDQLSLCNYQNNLSIFCKFLSFEGGLGNPRIRIWLSTFSMIKERPIWGWGSSTFSEVLPYKNIVVIPYKNLFIQHSHNIILEIAHNFGIPTAIILIICVSKICFDAFKLILIKQNINFLNNILNRSWILSLLIILYLQLFDITYYDGKISLILVILLAGAKCITEESPKLKNIIN